MKHRSSRVKELIQRELGSIILRELTFEAQLVTVHSVDLTPDFKNCHVHVSAIGDDGQKQRAVMKLRENRGLLQHELSKRVILKYTPHLHFHLDDSIERGTKVMEILRQIGTELPEEQEGEDYEQ